MSNDLAISLSQDLLWQALVITSPVIAVAVICGLIVSILQVVTQIQDATLSIVPKLLAVILMLMFCSSWMLHSLTHYAEKTIAHIAEAL